MIELIYAFVFHRFVLRSLVTQFCIVSSFLEQLEVSVQLQVELLVHSNQ